MNEHWLWLGCLALVGCASAPPARTVRLTDVPNLGTTLAAGQPLVIEVHEGDVLPLDFKLSGPLFESPVDQPPILLQAKRNFFLRIDEDGLRSSLDGKSFDKKPAAPGQFRVGIGATKERGVRAEIVIKSPTPAEP